VVKTNVFLQDMNDFAAMNEVYAEGFYFSINYRIDVFNFHS